MNLEPFHPRPRRLRAALVAGALGVASTAGALIAAPAAIAVPTTSPIVSPSHAPTTSLAVDLPSGTSLSLPAADGTRDSFTVGIRSGEPGLIDVDAVHGTKRVHIGTHLKLATAAGGWGRSVTIRVARLTTGRWRILVQRFTDRTTQARSRTFAVTTGRPVHVSVRTNAHVLYPYRGGSLDSAIVTVVARDESQAAVPVSGTIRIDAGKKHITTTLSKSGSATLPVVGLPFGRAVMTTKVRNASGSAVRRTTLTIARSGVKDLRVALSSDTVEPVVDGMLDSVVFTTAGAASSGPPTKVSGTLTVSRAGRVAKRFVVTDGRTHTFSWDGRIDGKIVAGTYKVVLALTGSTGPGRTTTTDLLVSKAHLPYAVREMFTVAAGNQQGLAVRNGNFYVGYDIGNDLSRIDVYDSTGGLWSSVGPLPIPHVAELAYSTTTGMLYAATGGANTPTKVFVLDPLDPQWTMATPTDPVAVIKDTFDLSGRLGNNAMVSVDDANARLLVFSGATGDFSISSVSMSPTPVIDADGEAVLAADGTPQVVPAGTITSTVPIKITGTPQGMDLVGHQLWIYTSMKKVNHVAKYDLGSSSLMQTSSASGSADLYWGGEGEGMATVDASDTGDGLPAWIYVGAHDAAYKTNKLAPNHLGELVPVTDNE